MKRDLIVAVLLTFCLTSSIFMIATSQSAEYDAWEDINGDGKIDIFDIVTSLTAMELQATQQRT